MRLREDETTRVREELANLRHVLDAINGEFAVDLEAKTALLKKENVQLTQQRDEALTALEEANSKLSQVSTDSDKSLFLEQQLHAKDQEIEKLRAESTVFDSSVRCQRINFLLWACSRSTAPHSRRGHHALEAERAGEEQGRVHRQVGGRGVLIYF